jgi:hypothetical protein
MLTVAALGMISEPNADPSAPILAETVRLPVPEVKLSDLPEPEIGVLEERERFPAPSPVLKAVVPSRVIAPAKVMSALDVVIFPASVAGPPL